MAEVGRDTPLEELRARLEATQQATERLARETADLAGGAATGTGPDGRVPPAGFQVPPSASEASGELRSLVDLLETLRNVLPEDIRRQVTEIVRQLLLLVRALIDWWISRMDRGPAGREVPVEDIPIG